MLVSKALEDSYNEGLKEGRLIGRIKFLKSLLRYELRNGNSKEQFFKKIIEIDPNLITSELLEEAYSSLFNDKSINPE